MRIVLADKDELSAALDQGIWRFSGLKESNWFVEAAVIVEHPGRGAAVEVILKPRETRSGL